MDKPGYETYEEMKKWMAIAHEEGKKFYEDGNKAAGARARKAFDRIAVLKIQWRKETCK